MRKQAALTDPDDVLYSLKSSGDYDPEADWTSIRALALNFGGGEFNPTELGILDRLMSRVRYGRFVVKPGSETA